MKYQKIREEELKNRIKQICACYRLVALYVDNSEARIITFCNLAQPLILFVKPRYCLFRLMPATDDVAVQFRSSCANVSVTPGLRKFFGR